MSTIYDSRTCFLGEGPLWHPQRQQLFWFDIINKRLLSRNSTQQFEWAFEEFVSAAAWVNQSTLLVASETSLLLFDIDSGQIKERVVEIEADNALTRSNDGRADPYGGFWIGTMGKNAEAQTGSIYRFYLGELRKVHSNISIPNSICFSLSGEKLYFADTQEQQIWSQRLDQNGWPEAEPEVFVDLRGKGLFPDGSTVDSKGHLWNAQWGSGSVARYNPKGEFIERIYVGGAHSSCPAFGGEDGSTLFVTTAQEGLEQPSSADGAVYCETVNTTGMAEPKVIL